jgi:uncharacterized repeat protein (TIGR03803 family)
MTTGKLELNRNRKPRVVTALLAWGLAIVPAMIATPSAAAQTFKLLYAFTGGADGGGPWGTPLLTGGDIYCTTFYGGSPSSNQAGTVFELFLFNPPFGYPIYAFAGQPYDGAAPMSGLVTDGFGDFFGTTTQGGFTQHGTIYEISQGTESVVQVLNGSNGATPEGSLLMDPLGDLYGTTSEGGANDSGSVFAFTAFGSFVSLYSFGNYAGDGVGPASGLVLQVVPNNGVPYIVLYGTTTEGGAHGWGTVFSVNTKTKTETVLYSFHGAKDGGTPVGGLALDGKGNLYGTTSAGGSAHGTAGNGVVFKLNIKSHQYGLAHSFTGADGSQPLAALLPDGKGNFYGTTYAGGAHGYGTVFELNSAGALTTLYSFTNGTDGSYPYAGVTMDSSGNLYGAATGGGQYGWGTIFEIVP